MIEEAMKEEEIGLHFLKLCQRKLRQHYTGYDDDDDDEDEEQEYFPTELNPITSSGGFAVVAPDKLSVRYSDHGIGIHSHDIGVVQGNRVAPKKLLAYYFEIFIKNAGVRGQISIGFTSENFLMRRQPGWEVNSIGYHGDDGFLYRAQEKGEPFGETYTAGDTVGAGINYAADQFFFTKNGRVVGRCYKFIKVPVFPTVAVHGLEEEVSVNFGQEPFVFGLKGFEAHERMKQQMKIDEIEIPGLGNVSYGIIRSYLLHYGYGDTLDSLDSDLAGWDIAHVIDDEQERRYALDHRRTLRKLIWDGEIDVAFGKLREWYPEMAEYYRSVMCFLLHCQKFIELVRVGASEEAVKYGRMELSSFFSVPMFEDFVEECVGLLAYERPSEHPVGYFLTDLHREIVADTVNAMILSTNPNIKDSKSCLHSNLARLLKQLTACCLERRALSGKHGESFRLRSVLSSDN